MLKPTPVRVDSPPPDEPALSRDRALAQLERAENFPVALRLLPKAVRAHLQAIYDIARVIDDLGDQGAGDSSADLRRLRAELDRIWSEHPPMTGVLGRLVPTVRACDLGPEPFRRLIEANLQDQTVHRYQQRADLVAYCRLSADPIGRLVLAVFGASTPHTVARSDQICTALQILEHCQDVGEDFHRGRIYLPLDDLARFGVPEGEFGGSQLTTAGRRLLEFEVRTAENALREGESLIGLLHGWARVAVAGYLAGGLATVDALRRAGWQVLPAGPRPRRRDVARHALRLLVTAGRHSVRRNSGRRR